MDIYRIRYQGNAEPNGGEPLDTYQNGDVVMLDDGNRQILGMREMGMWLEMLDGDAIPQPDHRPMFWSAVPDQVKYDMM